METVFTQQHFDAWREKNPKGTERGKELVIPEGFECFGENTFHKKHGLDAIRDKTNAGLCIRLPSTMKKLCENQFSFFKMKEVTIASSMKIPKGCFSGCFNLVTVKFADGIKISEVGDVAFWNASKLKKIVFPEGLKKIGERAFQLCSSLREVYLPSTLTEIGYGAFYSCPNLKKIIIDKANPKYAFKDGFLYDKQEGVCLSDTSDGYEQKKFVTPDFLKKMVFPVRGDPIIEPIYNMTELVISEGVEEVSGLENCKNIVSISIPSTLKTIYLGWCRKIKKINLSPENKYFKLENGILHDGKKVIACISTDEHLEFPKGLKEIETLMKCCVENVKSITFPEGFTDDNMALSSTLSYRKWRNDDDFHDFTTRVVTVCGCCKKLEKISLPSTMKTFEEDFSKLVSLKEITVAKGNKYFSVENGSLLKKTYSSSGEVTDCSVLWSCGK